jgi:hypothetical protein
MPVGKMKPDSKLTEDDLIDTLNDLGLAYHRKGDEIILDRCPSCETDRTKKSEHFSFNAIDLIYHCFKCNSSGNLYTFRRENGLDPFPKEKYILPDQKKVSAYRNQKEEFYQKYSQKRGISVETLKKYGVGMAETGQGATFRTYPYQDVGGEIVNVKYVSADKKMHQEKGAKQIYYGLQFVDFGMKSLVVCEGEDDCHALVDYGVKNVVSVPGGSGSYNDNLHEINNKFSKIYLVFDNDRPGQEGAEKFARKAGLWKCWNVILPFKDARDCLLQGLSRDKIHELFEKAKQFDMSSEKCRPALSISERLERFEKDIISNPKGVKFDLPPIDEITGGMRPGTVMTLLANPGCFKTTTLINMLIRAAIRPDFGGIAIFFSFEMQIESSTERELQIYYQCKNMDLYNAIMGDKDEWKKKKEYLISSTAQNLYVSEEPFLTIPEIIEVIKRTEAVTQKKCLIVGIDYLDFIRASSSREYEAVKENMNALKSAVSRGLNTSVIVLCQTNRNDNRDSSDEVGLRSGKGGTGIEAASDYLIGMWIDENDNICAHWNKHRRVSSEYMQGPNPYMHLDIDPKTYFLKEIIYAEKPTKSEKKEQKEYRKDW